MNKPAVPSSGKTAVPPQQQKKRPAAKQEGPKASVEGEFITLRLRKWQFAVLVLAPVLVILGIIIYYNQDTGTIPAQTAAMEQEHNHATVDLAAIEQAKQYIEQNPTDAQAILALSHQLHDGNLYAQAIEYYKKYLALVPENSDARVDMGVCYFSLKEYQTAIETMRIAVDAHPDHLQGNFNLGIVYHNMGKLDSARMWFERTVAIDASSEIGKNAQRILDRMKTENPS